jgi:para-aminobenzoate synthetase component 1
VPADAWRSDLDQAGYLARVGAIKRSIEAGDVYQVNLCRRMSAPLAVGADPAALAALLAAGNPAPHAAVLCAEGEWLVPASPELFLSRDGDVVRSAPIKGTAPAGVSFAPKDSAENVMITDLVRNDLNRVCRPDSVRVVDLLATEHHPGLSHLVSTVQGRLRRGVGWPELLSATFPPGSVTGAPKIRAVALIRELELGPRDVYCGAVGVVDADRGRATLAVGIRTFFTSDGASMLHFGTGAGITYPSDPAAEWAETELKAARLVGLASGVQSR